MFIMTKKIIITGILILLPIRGFSQQVDTVVKSKTDGFFGIIYIDYHNYIHAREISTWGGVFRSVELDTDKAKGININVMGGYFFIPDRLSLAGGIGTYRGYSPDVFGFPLINGDLRYYFTNEKNTLFSFVNVGHTIKATFNNRGSLYRTGIGYKFNLTEKLLVSTDVSLVIPTYSKIDKPYRVSNYKLDLHGIGFSFGIYIF